MEKKKLTLLQETCILYFGEENIDILEHKTIIRFEEFYIVKLSDGSRHLIKDLFVVLCEISPNKINRVCGFRGTLSDKEYVSHYAHSHLERFTYGQITSHSNSFCLGDSDLRTLVSTSLSGIFTQDDWFLLCLTLENYVKCESNGPYINFNSIGESSDVNVSDIDISRILSNYCSSSIETYNLPIELTGNILKPLSVVITDEFLRELVPHTPDVFLGCYDEVLGYGVKPVNSTLFYGTLDETYVFKNERKNVTVYSTQDEKINVKLDFPVKQLKDKLIIYLNNSINETHHKRESKRNPGTRYYSGDIISDSYIANMLSS